MNKKYLALAVILAFTGTIAIAQLPATDSTITVTNERKTALASLDLLEITASETKCTTPDMVCMTTIEKGSALVDVVAFEYSPEDTPADLAEKRDREIKASMETIADRKIEQDKHREEIKLGAGTITIQ